MLLATPTEIRPANESRAVSPTNSICPACSHGVMEPFIDLGFLPVRAGARYSTAEAARTCPRGRIHLAFCPACAFVANMAFSPDRLDYSSPYDNDLSASAVYRDYEQSQARRLVETYGIRRKRVLEIGCGSGSFLRALCAAGDNRGLGYDPSLEKPGVDADDRIEFVSDHYPGLGSPQRADLIVCRQVFEHVPSPLEFLIGLRATLNDSPDTILFFEVPSFDDVLRRSTFWTIIFEHCGYFGRESLAGIFERSGFEVCNMMDCYENTFLGIEVKPTGGGMTRSATRGDVGLSMSERVMTFLIQFEEKMSLWRRQMGELSRDGKRVVAWGAGARAISFFNLLSITEQVPYIVDMNPNKGASYLPGTAQQVVPPQFLREYRPDTIIIMNSIYREEIENMLRRLGLSVDVLCP